MTAQMIASSPGSPDVTLGREQQQRGILTTTWGDAIAAAAAAAAEDEEGHLFAPAAPGAGAQAALPGADAATAGVGAVAGCQSAKSRLI